MLLCFNCFCLPITLLFWHSMSNNSRVPLSVGKTVNTVKFSDRFSVPPILLWLRDIISAATRAKLQTRPAHMDARQYLQPLLHFSFVHSLTKSRIWRKVQTHSSSYMTFVLQNKERKLLLSLFVLKLEQSEHSIDSLSCFEVQMWPCAMGHHYFGITWACLVSLETTCRHTVMIVYQLINFSDGLFSSLTYCTFKDI